MGKKSSYDEILKLIAKNDARMLSLVTYLANIVGGMIPDPSIRNEFIGAFTKTVKNLFSTPICQEIEEEPPSGGEEKQPAHCDENECKIIDFTAVKKNLMQREKI